MWFLTTLAFFSLLFSTEGHLTDCTTALSLSKSPCVDQLVFLLSLGMDVLVEWGNQARLSRTLDSFSEVKHECSL